MLFVYLKRPLKYIMVTDNEIIKTFFRNSRGIRGCARTLGISKIRVAKVILKYKRINNIR